MTSPLLWSGSCQRAGNGLYLLCISSTYCNVHRQVVLSINTSLAGVNSPGLLQGVWGWTKQGSMLALHICQRRTFCSSWDGLCHLPQECRVQSPSAKHVSETPVESWSQVCVGLQDSKPCSDSGLASFGEPGPRTTQPSITVCWVPSKGQEPTVQKILAWARILSSFSFSPFSCSLTLPIFLIHHRTYI